MKKPLGGLIGISLNLCFALCPVFAQTPPNTLTFENQFAEFELVKHVDPTTVTVEVPNGQDRTSIQNVVCLWVGGVYSNRAFPPEDSYEKDLIRETKRFAQAHLKNFNVRNSSYRSLGRCKNGMKIKVYSMPIKAPYQAQEGIFRGFPQSHFSGVKVWGILSAVKFGDILFEKDWNGEVTFPANVKGHLENRNMNIAPNSEALKNSNLSVLIAEGAKLLSQEDSREAKQ